VWYDNVVVATEYIGPYCDPNTAFGGDE